MVIFLPLFGQERAIDPAFIGLIISLRAVGSMGSRLILGKVSQHISDRALLLSSTTVSMFACAGMVYTNSAVILGALVFIAGFSSGFGQPLTMALISHRTKADERALAVSARLTGNRLGQFLVPLGSGVIAGAFGSGSAFLALALLVASGGIVSVSTSKEGTN